MTVKNSVLLMIKQYQGISFNSLLGKTASSYSSMNSAKASLSRTLKDCLSLGLITKKGGHFFITDKGAMEINSEMKNKLLMKLNSLLKTKNAENEIESIVQYLQTLIERAKEDSELLKAAKASSQFNVSELIELNKRIELKARHLDYLSKIFFSHIEALKEFNFNDFFSLELNWNSLESLARIQGLLKAQEFFLESNDLSFIGLVSAKFNAKKKENSLLLPVQSLDKLLELASENFLYDSSKNLSLEFSGIKIFVHFPSITFIGPHKELNEIKSLFKRKEKPPAKTILIQK